MEEARLVHVRGIVQGVGFRPFVFRLAQRLELRGWVVNDGDGVRIHAEGGATALDALVRQIRANPPTAARIDSVDVRPAEPRGLGEFAIRASERSGAPTAHISPDLPICDRCLAELLDPDDRRAGYPYVNCTECGPRHSIVLALPYDRPNTTMRHWPMCAACEGEYHDPEDRRFHAQPVACPECGPHLVLKRAGGGETVGSAAVVSEAAAMLCAGQIVAVKGLGGYHLACDAADEAAVQSLRERKFRKEKPFAVMVRDLAVAGRTVRLSADVRALLTSAARPIVVARALAALPGVAPGSAELGVMLPYTPLHHLLFAAGAPERLVMTSANRSSEPIAYRDDEALTSLAGIADAVLVGERPIARRIDDSVVRAGPLGATMLRRARGYAPGVVARLPTEQPILALGADLKNAITLVVRGDAVTSQHLGDLEHYEAYLAFTAAVRDLASMYNVAWGELRVAHDLHPQYATTQYASSLGAGTTCAVQHHRAHVASVLAERGAWETRVVGVAFDGTGYGDDGSIWGGEFFAGSVHGGLHRVAHLRAATLPGGDAAARHPVQAAAGFLAAVDGLPDLADAPFSFPARYRQARALVDTGVRTLPTTSVGRLFDTVAALLGFTRETTYEGQAAIWLEGLARTTHAVEPLPFPFTGGELDYRPALLAVAEGRRSGRSVAEIARAFHAGLARATADAIVVLCEEEGTHTAVLSGGVFQNLLLLEEIAARLRLARVRVWTNRHVPPNDGGISLGQAALAMATR